MVGLFLLFSPAHTALAGNLVGYWKFDELTGGTNATDSSGTGYTGTPLGSGGTQNGPQPSTTVKAPTDFTNPASLYFDGDDDYLDLPDGFADFTNGMTITLWARPTAQNSWARFFDFGNGAASDNIIVARNGGSTNFYYEAYRGGGTRKTSVINPPIILNEWHYYTVTMNPVSGSPTDSFVQVYVDGTLASMDTTLGFTPRNILRTKNYIGKSNWGDPYYKGYIDDLRIYDRALTPTEVEALSDGEAGPQNAPQLTSFTPSDNATNVSATANLVLNFDQDVTADVGTLTIYKADHSIVETFNKNDTDKISGDGTSSITINPSTTLEDNAQYYINIDSGAFKHGTSTYAGIQNSTDWSFTTGDFTGPVISNLKASAITDSSAKITWTTNEDASTKLKHGKTATYGTISAETNTSPRVKTHEVLLENLATCTKYHYQATATDAVSNTIQSSDTTFTTTGCKYDSLRVYDVEYSVTESSILVRWKTDHDADSEVRYGERSSLGEKDKEDKRVERHSMRIDNLQPNTEYFFRVNSEDKDENKDSSKIYSVTTNKRSFAPSLSIFPLEEKTSVPVYEKLSIKTEASTANATTTIQDSQKKSENSDASQKGKGPFETGVSVQNGQQYIKEVRFQVIKEGNQPVANLAVTLHSEPRSGTTNEEGLVSFYNVPTGDHHIAFHYEGKTIEKSVTIDNVQDINAPIKTEAIVIKIAPDPLPFWIYLVIGLLILIIIFFLFLLWRRRKEDEEARLERERLQKQNTKI